ncbi:thiolase family protein [Subtercola boreus]|uniref:Acetyl-CoA acetyltransferase n=1 Tax=Subtercola boreus TaxID=120213 RepID=A0A3E0WF87_9MICO|nr:thiolase family protein [Subtercola boreus]RFA22763.1 acetyl-CoA acetyltransferase [Subtercola boreus]RFA23118.1 acetyl-CoA acetyltransferase [Subtercola boreus]RFA28871.1 acetyl-CoA acetyltransferase [Subtercola boreus]
MSREAVIVEAVRTPLGKRGGLLAGVHPADLSAYVLQALAARTGIDPGLVEDVMWGCVGQIGEQSFDIARTAVLSAGWPEHVPGTTVDRQCGSSQQAVNFAAASILAGHYDIVVAGGVESMSRVPMGSSTTAGGSPLGALYTARYGPEFPNQGIGAEQIAAEWKISRTALDEFALASHAKAAAAIDRGAFASQIVPVTTADGVVDADQGVRRGGTLEKLASLAPAFTPDGVVTAGNASQISDGSAALMLMGSDTAAELGLTPIAAIDTVAVVGSAPMPMLTGPIPATEKLLARKGISIDDIGTFEVNEAFASVVLAWLHDTKADESRLNPNGGAIALGHPLGASGARIMTTMLNHMRENDLQYGLQVMCEGGGQANATLLRLL